MKFPMALPVTFVLSALLLACSRENNAQTLNIKMAKKSESAIKTHDPLSKAEQQGVVNSAQQNSKCELPLPVPRVLSRREITSTLKSVFGIPLAENSFQLKWPQSRSNYFSTMASDNNLSASQLRVLLDDIESDLISVVPKILEKYSCLKNQDAGKQCDAIEQIFSQLLNRKPSVIELQKLSQNYTSTLLAQNQQNALLNVLLSIVMHPDFLMRPELEKQDSSNQGDIKLSASRSESIFKSLLRDGILPAQGFANELKTSETGKGISIGLKYFLNELLGTIYLTEETAKISHINKQQGEAMLQKFELTLSKMNQKIELKLSDLIGQWSGDAFEKPNTLFFHPTVIGIHSGSGDTKPVERGNYILKALFCQSIAPPKGVAEINNAAFKSKPAATKADHFNFRMSRPDCAACHGTLEPLGFLFEPIDSYGNAKAQFETLPPQKFKISSNEFSNGSLEEFVAQAQNSSVLRRCFATQYFRYAIGRKEKDSDKCLIDDIEKSLIDSSGSLVAMENYMLKLYEMNLKK